MFASFLRRSTKTLSKAPSSLHLHQQRRGIRSVVNPLELSGYNNLYGSQANKSPEPLNFLVVDGYSAEGRQGLIDGGASTAGDLYAQMLHKSSPYGATSTIVYPAEPEFDGQMDISEYDGIAWTGCSLTVYHDTPEVESQIQFAQQIYELGVPSFGSCWAVQIAAVAAGGMCAANPFGREMGISRKIALTDAGRGHPMYEGKPSVFDAFTSHEDEITHCPASSLILATNNHSLIQALSANFRGGPWWGVQYHPEYDLKELAMLTSCRIERLTGMGFFKDTNAAETYVEEILELHEDPNRKDLRWKYGLDHDVMSEDVRLIETRNWISKLVKPYSDVRKLRAEQNKFQ